MSITRIRHSRNSETWRIVESWHTRYVRIEFDEDEDAVFVSGSAHKEPWVCDGEKHDSFAAARASEGLPEEDPDGSKVKP